MRARADLRAGLRGWIFLALIVGLIVIGVGVAVMGGK